MATEHRSDEDLARYLERKAKSSQSLEHRQTSPESGHNTPSTGTRASFVAQNIPWLRLQDLVVPSRLDRTPLLHDDTASGTADPIAQTQQTASSARRLHFRTKPRQFCNGDERSSPVASTTDTNSNANSNSSNKSNGTCKNALQTCSSTTNAHWVELVETVQIHLSNCTLESWPQVRKPPVPVESPTAETVAVSSKEPESDRHGTVVTPVVDAGVESEHLAIEPGHSPEKSHIPTTETPIARDFTVTDDGSDGTMEPDHSPEESPLPIGGSRSVHNPTDNGRSFIAVDIETVFGHADDDSARAKMREHLHRRTMGATTRPDERAGHGSRTHGKPPGKKPCSSSLSVGGVRPLTSKRQRIPPAEDQSPHHNNKTTTTQKPAENPSPITSATRKTVGHPLPRRQSRGLTEFMEAIGAKRQKRTKTEPSPSSSDTPVKSSGLPVAAVNIPLTRRKTRASGGTPPSHAVSSNHARVEKPAATPSAWPWQLDNSTSGTTASAAPELGRSNPSLVVWNKDGTLLDFQTTWIGWIESQAWRLEAALGRPIRELFFDALGYNWQALNLLVGQGLAHEEAVQLIHQHWSLPSEAATYRPREDLKQLFQSVSSLGVKIAICTSDRRAATMKTLSHLGIEKLVDHVSCGDDGLPSRPERIWSICSQVGVTPGNTIMVGDTPDDMILGRNAGCALSIGVLGGALSLDELAGEADVLVPSVNNITKVLFQYRQQAPFR